MRSISDNELDKLFQDAAQHVEPEFDPGDWEKLSKRIDRSDRINLFKRIAIYLSVALLIIFSTWIGVNYNGGQSNNKKDSAGNSVENGIADISDNEKKETDSDTNSTVQNTDIDINGDAANGTSTGSSSGETTSSSSIQNDQSSSAGQQASSSEKNRSIHESKDIAREGKHRTETSTSSMADQSLDKTSLKKGNVQRKSGSPAQKTTASSARKKDQDGEAIKKNAGSIETSDDQQKLQKPKRTVARAKWSSDEGSLSASGNSNSDRINEKLSSTSTDQQQVSSVNNERKSSLNGTTVEDENAAETPAINTNASVEKQNAAASNDTLAIENTGIDVKNDPIIPNDSTIAGNNNKTPGTGQVTTGSNTSSSGASDQKSDEKSKSSSTSVDTLTMNDIRTKGKNVQDDSAKSNIADNQSGDKDQTIADGDSLSSKPSSLKSKGNVVLTGDAKAIAKKSTGSEERTGIVSNESSAEKSTSKENSLSGRESNFSNVKNNGISVSDTIATIDSDPSNTKNNTLGKIKDSGLVVDNNKQSAEADRVSLKSDSLSGKQADVKSKGIYTSVDKNEKVFTPGENNDAIDKASVDRNAGMAKQNSSSVSGLSSDSLSNQKEFTAAEKVRKESNFIAVNDSTKSKSLSKVDSVDHAIDNKEATDDKKENEEKVKDSNWYVKLLVSPDFSAIGYTRPGKTGLNIGLTVEYSPVKHWGISVGAIWSKKLYDKNNPGKSYSFQGTSFEADYLDGDCRVLDIPINITYYILPEARLNFYATVGVSSYIMLKENYVYTVTENNNSYHYYEDYKNENRHWFSMLNLSFGLQYRIGPRLQFQAEPFLKAPMSGVGQGKIDLVSAGSFFTLKYKINK